MLKFFKHCLNMNKYVHGEGNGEGLGGGGRERKAVDYPKLYSEQCSHSLLNSFLYNLLVLGILIQFSRVQFCFTVL